MAFELLSETPPLLRSGHVVFFEDKTWDPKYAGKWFRVVRAQQVPYNIGRIVSANASIDLDFSAPAGGGVGDTNLSLLPDHAEELFEILFGIKGTPLVYPRYQNQYFLSLAVTNVIPDTGDANLRYLGFYNQDDSPFDEPRLREHIVKDNGGVPVLRVYNDFATDEKIVLRAIVNRIRMDEVKATAVSPEVQLRARRLKHHKSFAY